MAKVAKGNVKTLWKKAMSRTAKAGDIEALAESIVQAEKADACEKAVKDAKMHLVALLEKELSRSAKAEDIEAFATSILQAKKVGASEKASEVLNMKRDTLWKK